MSISGKMLTAISVALGPIAFVAMVGSAARWESLPAISRYSIFFAGLIATVAALWAWFRAIAQWQQHRPRSAGWLAALLIFTVIGGWCYWIVGPGDRAGPDDHLG